MTQQEERYFSTYQEFEAYLMEKGLFHMDLSLERIANVLDELELTRPPFVVAQVVGTNGKGSTSAFLASLGQSTGLNVGLYTSPHFVTPRERIRVNGQMLDEDDWCDLASDVMDAGGAELTYFEFLTVIAVLAFSDYEVDMAVFEAGLGGLHDATTALGRDLVAFTPIAMDHESVLGTSLDDIARDKAAAMASGAIVVTAPQQETVAAVLRDVASAKGISLEKDQDHGTLPENVNYGLTGPHQKENARLALAAYKLMVEEHNWNPPDFMTWDDVKDIAMADAWLAGRLQVVEATDEHSALLLDGAHNAHGLEALRAALAEQRISPRVIIFGCMQDKALDDIVPQLLQIGADRILLPAIPENDRAMPPDVLQKKLGDAASVTADMRTALQEAKELLKESTGESASIEVLVCGSLYLLAEFFTLHPSCLNS